MRKNVASQSIGAQMLTAADHSNFTSPVTVYITLDNGIHNIGSVGSGVCTHKGHGYHCYTPSQAETNCDHFAYTFIGSGAITNTVTGYTIPTTGLLAPFTYGRTLVIGTDGNAGADLNKVQGDEDAASFFQILLNTAWDSGSNELNVVSQPINDAVADAIAEAHNATTNATAARTAAESAVSMLNELTAGSIVVPVNQVPVPSSRTWIVKSSSDGLVGEVPLFRRVGESQTFAIDWRNDMTANARLSGVSSITVSPETGVTISDDENDTGVDHALSKFKLTIAAAGTYTITTIVGYDLGEGSGTSSAEVTLVVRDAE